MKTCKGCYYLSVGTTGHETIVKCNRKGVCYNFEGYTDEVV